MISGSIVQRLLPVDEFLDQAEADSLFLYFSFGSDMNSQDFALKSIVFAVAILLTCSRSQADIITFGSSNSALPYSESGYVFTSLSGSSSVVQQIENLSNRLLNLSVTNPGGQPSNVRLAASGGGAFNLVSLQLIGSSSFPWEIQGSNGSTYTVANGTAPSTLNFASLGDWTNLTSVNFVHTAGQVNANLRIDNINVNAVPEPSCLAITALVALGIAKRRLRPNGVRSSFAAMLVNDRLRLRS